VVYGTVLIVMNLKVISAIQNLSESNVLQ